MTLAPLLRRLAAQCLDLLAENLALARVEIGAKLKLIAVAIALLIFVILLAVAILATSTACLILALALVVPPWLAALIVAAAYAVVAIVALIGVRVALGRALPPIPTRAMRQFKENVQWAKDLTTSNER